MTSIGTLWASEGAPKTHRILAAAALVGVSFDPAVGYVHHEDNLKPPFLAKFPLGKIPAFEANDGFRLFEASAIARYVASLKPDAHLLGHDAHEEALVDQWIAFLDTELQPYGQFLVQISTGRLKPYSKAMYDSRRDGVVRSLRTLETHLSTRTFLVGERVTLADLALTSYLTSAYKFLIDAPLRKETPNLLRYYHTVSNQPALKAIWGETEFCEKMVAGPPKKE